MGQEKETGESQNGLSSLEVLVASAPEAIYHWRSE
jgi:hypothetical protein